MSNQCVPERKKLSACASLPRVRCLKPVVKMNFDLSPSGAAMLGKAVRIRAASYCSAG